MKEAKEFIHRYFETYPKIQTFIEDNIQFAKNHQYAKTLGGRKRPIPDITTSNRMAAATAENIAVNTPVQGSAADLIKLAMINTKTKLAEKGLKARLLLQVHDELVLECPKDQVEEVEKIVKESMESAMKLKIPIDVKIGHGENWLEAH